jgi:hypothetical protein
VTDIPPPAPSVHSKPIRLAAAIVTDFVDGRITSAGRRLKRLHDECGWDGIWLAVLATCDTFHYHACDGDIRPVAMRPAAMVYETGAIITDRSRLPAHVDWAHRLVAARVAMDEVTYLAVQRELFFTEAEPGPYIAAVFEAVGLTIRSMPRGYALMGVDRA